MDKIIQVKTKNVYGKEVVYPDCSTSALFASIAKTKTLSDDVLATIAKLGYQIREVSTSRFNEGGLK